MAADPTSESMRADCLRCGHSSDWHRLDDATNPWGPGDPRSTFRCIGYDCTKPGPWNVDGCYCPDMVRASAPVDRGET